MYAKHCLPAVPRCQLTKPTCILLHFPAGEAALLPTLVSPPNWASIAVLRNVHPSAVLILKRVYDTSATKIGAAVMACMKN